MDISKRASFVRKMGKKRLRFAKGGHVKRQHFDGGGIAGLLGAAGGQGGSGFNTPSGTNGAQIASNYAMGQDALQNQMNLVSTLTPQATSAVAAQNVLSGQYANQAAGQGPNVAQDVLHQATGANVANQAALMAGQRGASSNPGLMARQAAQVGAGVQQQAAGQAATTQAQQQIAAQQAQAQLANNQIGQTQNATTADTQATQGEQSILQGANTANNNINGQLAQTTMQGSQAALGSAAGMIGPAAMSLLAHGGEVHGHKKLDFIHKMAKMGLEHFDGGGLAVPQVQSQVAQPIPFAPIQQVQGGFSEGPNKGAEALANIGKQDHKPKPAAPAQMSMIETQPVAVGPAGSTDLSDLGTKAMAAHGGVMEKNWGHVANFLAGGGKVPAMVSPGEVYLRPDQVQDVVKGGANPLAIGEKIPGKAKVKGDSYKNDFVKKDLEAGGVVVDRENVMNPKKAAKFVQKSVAKKKAGGK